MRGKKNEQVLRFLFHQGNMRVKIIATIYHLSEFVTVFRQVEGRVQVDVV